MSYLIENDTLNKNDTLQRGGGNYYVLYGFCANRYFKRMGVKHVRKGV